MAKQIKCPKCGRPQGLSNFCVECGLDFREYIRRQREKRAEHRTEGPAKATEGIRDIGKLFEDSWVIYKERFAPLFILNLLVGAFLLVPVLALALIGMSAGVLGSDMTGIGAGAGAAVGFLIGSVLMFIPMAGLIAALGDNTLGVKDALKAGIDRLWPFLWLVGLSTFFITGGFLLFLIPGVIFFIWFLPAQFIVILEPEKGMDALTKSMTYTSGQWWNLLGRFFLIALLAGIAGVFPGGSLLFSPFMYVMLYLIYCDLKTEKGLTVSPAGEAARSRLWLFVPALLGYVLLTAMMIIAALSTIKDRQYIKTYENNILLCMYKSDSCKPEPPAPI